MIEEDRTRLAPFDRGATINAIPNGQDDETDTDDTESGKPDGTNQ